MLPLLPLERRWRDAMVIAMIPALAAADRADFWRRWDASTPLLLQLGVRAAVWALGAQALLTGRTFPRLAPDHQDRLVCSIVASRWFVLRQAGTALKLCASMALAHDPATRTRLEPREDR